MTVRSLGEPEVGVGGVRGGAPRGTLQRAGSAVGGLQRPNRIELAPVFWTGDRVRPADGLALEIAGELDADLLLTGGLLRALSR